MFHTGIMMTFLKCLLSLCVLYAQQQSAESSPSKISAKLHSILEKGESANVIVSFVGGIKPALDRAMAKRYDNRKLEINAIIDATKEHAADSQAGVLQALSARSAAGGGFKYFKQYWVGNKLFVKEANAHIIKMIAEDPKVLKINQEPIGQIPVEDASTGGLKVRAPSEGTHWGHERVQVQQAWEELGGKKGDGVVVGSIDTGVLHTHETIRDNFVGLEYGWYDAVKMRPEPTDLKYPHGHGTGTTSVLVGGAGVGVAPGAKWMACNAHNGYNMPGEALLDCIQWMACPTLPDGTNPDCSKAPSIVSNSWVVPRGAEDFNDAILQWRAMGIIPIFAIGNEGYRLCNSTLAPGEFPFVIGVGSTREEGDRLDDVSSTGYTSYGGIKPDLVAPGTDVRSASRQGDSRYVSKTGTSTATPFVSGVVALLKMRDPNLTFEQAFDLLTQNTNNVNPPEFEKCKNDTKHQFSKPSIFWGYGELNAFKVVQAQSRLLEMGK